MLPQTKYTTPACAAGVKDCFLVDGGGGNTILSCLDEAGVSLNDIRTIFVTHKHMDHLFAESCG